MDGTVRLHGLRAVYRRVSPGDCLAERIAARSTSARAAVVVVHLLPGVLAFLLLHHARETIASALGISEATAQVGVIMTSLMTLMLVAALAAPRLVDRLPRRDALELLGVTRIDPTGLVIACLLAPAVLLVPTGPLYADAFEAWLQDTPLGMPPWHFQRADAFEELPPVLAAVALVVNILGEELWFRGYLYAKLSFLRSWTWLVAGLLFVGYHVFQAPLTYPGFLGGLALSGLYALRRDLWSCVLLHALLQAPL